MPTTTLTDVYATLKWIEIIPGTHQAEYKGDCLEVEICAESNWVVYDCNDDVWLEGFCRDLADGKVKAFNAFQAESA